MKVALVTGANKGLGLETARQLGGQGYAVLIGARDQHRGEAAARTLRETGIDARFIKVDLNDAATFVTARETIERDFGRLDVLVNNAGVLDEHGRSAIDVPIESLRATFEVNFLRQVELTQTLLPLLRSAEAGRIVNVSSILGSLTMNNDPKAITNDWRLLGYNASKAALNMFTVHLAHLLSDTGIKVNSAHPGWVKTDLGGEQAPLDVEEGAKTMVELATLGPEGPTGGFFHLGRSLPW